MGTMKKIIYILFVCLTGCAYTTRPGVILDFKTIHIEPFENRIDITAKKADVLYYRASIAGIEIPITRTIEDVFKRDGRIRLTEKQAADLIMSGQVISFRREALRYNPDGTIKEARLHLTANVTVKTQANETVWSENISSRMRSSYLGAIIDTAALDSAIRDLAINIRNRTLEGW
jgi:hypothetical protein